MGGAKSHQLTRLCGKGKSMTIVTIGIDLAKNVFAIHGVDATGKASAGSVQCGPGQTA